MLHRPTLTSRHWLGCACAVLLAVHDVTPTSAQSSDPSSSIVTQQPQGLGFLITDTPLPCGAEGAWRDAYEAFRLSRVAEAAQLLDSLALALPLCAPRLPATALARVWYARAMIYVRLGDHPEATHLLLKIIAEVPESAFPRLLAEAHLARELVHEFLGAGPEADEALRESRRIIVSYDLEATWATYYVRASSYHRGHGSALTARAYADSALVYARRAGRRIEEADALFLGIALDSSSTPAQEVATLRAVARLYNEIGFFTNATYMYANIADVLTEAGQHRAALAVLDTVVDAANEGVRGGFSYDELYAGTYRTRSENYRALGEHDSAYANLARANRAELEYAYGLRAAEVLRLERAVEREQAAATLTTKEAEVAAERRRGRIIAWAAAVLGARRRAHGLGHPPVPGPAARPPGGGSPERTPQ